MFLNQKYGKCFTKSTLTGHTFHDAVNSYLGLREVYQNLMMTEACAATNCTMMEVGGAISSMMKLCEATKSSLSKGVRLFNYVYGNRC